MRLPIGRSNSGPASEAHVIPSPARRRMLGWSAGGGAALVGALVARGALAQTGQAPTGIVGSWLVSFPTGMADPNERQVVSFTSDGIMLASNTPSSPPDPQQGPSATRTYTTAGQGAWVAGTAGQVRFKFMNVDFDEQGNFADLTQITGTLALGGDGNSFSGSFQVLVTDAAGNVLFDSQGDAGTVQGTRISV